MLTNAIPKINPKVEYFSPHPAGGGCQLQHPKTVIGLSRRRLKINDVLKLIDSRQIRWAWDISRQGAHRPEIRIWRESMAAYLAQENDGQPAAPDNLSLAKVINSILPRPSIVISARAGTLRARELQRCWLCSQMLIRRLIEEGELCSVGPLQEGVSPALLYQSAVEFLKRRSLSV